VPQLENVPCNFDGDDGARASMVPSPASSLRIAARRCEDGLVASVASLICATRASDDVCIVRRMPRVQVYLPDDLHEQLKQRDLPASELLQIALRAELERQDALAEADRYLDELAAEVGEPSQRQQTTADAIARRIRDRSLDRVG
jgi:post-segregation antitoxin (ccd killing protein)